MSMKIHAYAVQYVAGENLNNIFQEMQNNIAAHAQNVRSVLGCCVRIENLAFQNGIWLANFIKELPGGGPRKFCSTGPAEGFEFDEDEGFGEETACLYDPETEHMVIQYNQTGVKGSQIASYLNQYLQSYACEIELKPKIDSQTQQKLDKKAIFKKISLTVDLNRVSASDFDQGMGLAKSIEYGKEAGGDTLKFEISVKRGPSGLRMGDLIAKLQSLLTGEDNPLRRFEVSGKDDKNSRTELLDLIDGRLVHEFNDIKLDKHKNYPVEERWNRLIRVHKSWLVYFQ